MTESEKKTVWIEFFLDGNCIAPKEVDLLARTNSITRSTYLALSNKNLKRILATQPKTEKK